MRYVVMIGCLLCSAVVGFSQPLDTALIPFRKGDKWGYCDPSGKLMIQPQFTEAHLFQGQLALAKSDSHCCVINRQGKILFVGDLFCPAITNGGSNYIGGTFGHEVIFDENGHALTPSYAEINPFDAQGYALFATDYLSHSGLWDTHFNVALEPAYNSVVFLSDNIVAVTDRPSGQVSLYDLIKRRNIPGQYDEIYKMKEGLFMARKNGLYGFLDTGGAEVIPFKYHNAVPLDYSLDESYPEETDIGYQIHGFSCGRAAVTEGGKTGYLDKRGRVVIPFTFEKGFGFSENAAWVRVDGKWGMIDTNGRFVLEPVFGAPEYRLYNESMLLEGFHEGRVKVSRSGKFGYANEKGELVIPCRYTGAQRFYKGLAAVRRKGKTFFIDRNGKEMIPPVAMYAELSEWSKELSVITFEGTSGPANENQWYIFDSTGEKKILTNVSNCADNMGFNGQYAVVAAADTCYVIDRQSRLVYRSSYGLQYIAGSLVFDYERNCYVDVARKIRYAE